MALAKCRECGKEISTEAKICPNCGAAKPTKASQRRIGLVPGCLILLVIFAIIGTIANGVTKSQATPAEIAAKAAADSAETNEFTAEAFCKQEALKLLKSPATAKWGDESDNYRHTDSPNHYHIQLQVDAQNSFGALLRTTVDCKVAQRGENMYLTSIKSWGR